MTASHSRRSFLQTTASLSATALSLGAADANDLEVGKHIYKSLKWNMVKLGGTTHDKFTVLKELGFDGVELDSPARILMQDHESTSRILVQDQKSGQNAGVDANEAVAASHATGLPIEGVVNSTHWKVRHSDPDPNVRKQAMALMRQAMRYTKNVGAESILLVPGKVTDPEKENHDQVWQRSIEALRELTPLADQLEIQILIENVGNGFCETPELFAQYIDEINHPRIGIHFDIGNHIRISPPAQWIAVLGKRIKKLDVKDRTKANERTLVGEGEADWPQVRAALQSLGYRGWAAAEVPGGDRDRLADVLERMNRVLGKSDGNPSSL